MSYQCAICKGVFEPEWTDEEAKEELRATFGNTPVEQCAVLCDDCYNKVMSL